MSDRDEIERLIFRYGYILDDREWGRLDELFSETGSFVIQNSDISVHGFAAVDEFMRGTTHPLAHYSTNVLIDVEEGADVATAQVKVFAPRADGTAMVGKYVDDIVRTPAGWRFEQRYVTVTERYWTVSHRV